MRVLARAWIRVIWRCWTEHEPYEPDRHHALTALLETQNQHTDTPESAPMAS